MAQNGKRTERRKTWLVGEREYEKRGDFVMINVGEMEPWAHPVRQQKAAAAGFTVPEGTRPPVAELAYLVARGTSYQSLIQMISNRDEFPGEGWIEDLNLAYAVAGLPPEGGAAPVHGIPGVPDSPSEPAPSE